MKFNVTKTSDYAYEEVVEISSLEELKEFQRKNMEHHLIIDFFSSHDPFIEIYDDYRE